MRSRDIASQLRAPSCCAPAPSGEKHALPFDDILKNPDWPTYSAQSQKLSCGIQAAFMWMFRTNKFDHVAKLRAIKLVPEGQIVWRKEDDAYLMVLQVLEASALCWPVERLCGNGFKVKSGLDYLEWLCITAPEELEVFSVPNCWGSLGPPVAGSTIGRSGLSWACHVLIPGWVQLRNLGRWYVGSCVCGGLRKANIS